MSNKQQAAPLVSLTLQKQKEGWSVVTITTQDNKVLSINKTEPDLKAIAIASFKVAALQLFSE